MEQLKDNGKLIHEIKGELKKQNLNAEKVVCSAAANPLQLHGREPHA
jgi:hypothetical protein